MIEDGVNGFSEEFKIGSRPKILNLDGDAFSNGQVTSKLWMCEIIEREFASSSALHLCVLGCWYALLPFLLLSRGQVRLSSLSLYDLDQQALMGARGLLENWICCGLPISFQKGDCNELTVTEWLSRSPDLVVNSSCEHLTSHKWIENLPPGTRVLLQSTNMKHWTHVLSPSSLSDFEGQLGNGFQWLWKGEKLFSYPDQSFSRYTLFGVRR
ncbi:MAG: hypothetical protein KDD35_05680 [Bdellovibrionales bacterium]|nr:hypothetical protein [Bdellovibrionales bacterium]